MTLDEKVAWKAQQETKLAERGFTEWHDWHWKNDHEIYLAVFQTAEKAHRARKPSGWIAEGKIPKTPIWHDHIYFNPETYETIKLSIPLHEAGKPRITVGPKIVMKELI